MYPIANVRSSILIWCVIIIGALCCCSGIRHPWSEFKERSDANDSGTSDIPSLSLLNNLLRNTNTPDHQVQIKHELSNNEIRIFKKNFKNFDSLELLNVTYTKDADGSVVAYYSFTMKAELSRFPGEGNCQIEKRGDKYFCYGNELSN